MIYFCRDERRRRAVADHPDLNGIDFVEVSADQRTLLVHFLKPLAPGALRAGQVRIDGGERIRDVAVTRATVGLGDQTTVVLGTEDEANVLRVVVSRPGDFSTYTLRLVTDARHDDPPSGFDPLLSAVEFSFKVDCPTDFDCRARRTCPPEPRDEPDISYLAKDYASFRQLMLDRLAVLAPEWRERNPADLGVALVELLAYVGDYLSYHQDAVATEAYLGTARLRVSVRRHARLVDYILHDGCNARAWAHVRVVDNAVRLEPGTQLLTRVPGSEPRVPPGSSLLDRALAQGAAVFETMEPATLYTAHNTIAFYTWGDAECCLPRGATRATLRDGPEVTAPATPAPDSPEFRGRRLRLRPGDVLIFQERRGPTTGLEADADPARRHAVRLTRVRPEARRVGDESAPPITPGDLVVDPLTGQPVVHIEWHPEDALPFPLCISARVGDQLVSDMSVALGNVVLADHGRTVSAEPVGVVPQPTLFRAPPSEPAGLRPAARRPVPVPPRFRPRLRRAPVTNAAPLPPAGPPPSAEAVTSWKPWLALPAVALSGGGIPWQPRRDLLGSGPEVADFVVECESDGTAYLRFGDDRHGRRPAPGMAFTARYRVGNGSAGNVGAGAIAHVVTDDERITEVSNPLPARGGVDAEPIEEVRQRAPAAFRSQQRAVTPDDYAAAAERHPAVQRAAATSRATGSWRTVFVTVDRRGGLPVDESFREEVRLHLERFRLAGHDVEVAGPRFVPLEVALRVAVRAGYARADVRDALRRALGRGGLFHPDNLTFGEPVYLSPIYAAAQAVEGVEFVEVTAFHRQGGPDPRPLEEGRLALGRLEIARLDDDPNFPEHGRLRLTLEGGR